MAWVDPKEQSAEQWAGATPDPVDDTVARATVARLPFQFTDQRRYEGTLPPMTLDGVTFRSAQVHVDGLVTPTHDLKLHARGFLWTEESGEPPAEAEPLPDAPESAVRARRFKIQVRREGRPTDTEPYGEYAVWERYQYGAATVEADGTVDYRPDPRTTSEAKGHREFESTPTPLQLPLSELELVRNPPFAAHVLRERDLWAEYGEVFRWHAAAFGPR